MTLIDVYTRTDAIPLLYELLKERPPEASISHRVMPTFEQHRQFVTRRPYEAWYLLSDDERAGALVGSIYLTKQREVGVFIFKAWQQMGYAARAVAMLQERHPGRLLANVAPGNEHSHHLFERKLGGKLIQLTYELRGEGNG